ncbi:MAG: hypothetical protein K0S70_4727 [Microbacterium sp.]|jgi:hypothetical protein|nr:hypothetical protein [Microbacterium sp.]
MSTDPEARESLADVLMSDAVMLQPGFGRAFALVEADAVLAWMAEQGYSKPREADTDEVDRVAAAIAKAADADYWVDEIGVWESLDLWEREAYPDNYPSSAFEDREWYRKQAHAAIAAGYSKQHPPAVTDEMVAAAIAAHFEEPGDDDATRMRSALRAALGAVRPAPVPHTPAGVSIAGLLTTATTPAGHSFEPDNEGYCWVCGNERDHAAHTDGSE